SITHGRSPGGKSPLSMPTASAWRRAPVQVAFCKCFQQGGERRGFMQLRTWAVSGIVGLALVAGVGSAAAQTGITAQCVAAERKADRDGANCVDRVANPCLEKPEGASTQGQVACIRGEAKQWDDVLTTEYRALLASLPPATVTKVREAQRQWLALRD